MGSDGRFGQLGRVGIADGMTIANGLCGFAAIGLLVGHTSPPGWGASLLDGRHGLVLTLVICGLVFDTLDGVVARRRGASGLGGHLDMMCDALTFGVVPALLLLQSPAADGAAGSVIAALVAGLYFSAVLVRLAVFSGSTDHEHGFVGMPCPPAAVAALALLLLAPGAVAVLVGSAAIAALMVSQHPWPHPGPLGMSLLAVLGCVVIALAFAGWIPVGLAAVLEGGCALFIGPLERGFHRTLQLVQSTRTAVVRHRWHEA